MTVSDLGPPGGSAHGRSGADRLQRGAALYVEGAVRTHYERGAPASCSRATRPRNQPCELPFDLAGDLREARLCTVRPIFQRAPC
jgi:hypothetical protein